MSSNAEYKPGDVANGHLLTQDGQWVPLPAPQPIIPPALEKKKGMGKGAKITIGVVGALVLMGACNAITSAAGGGTTPTTTSVTVTEKAAPPAAGKAAAPKAAAPKPAAPKPAAPKPVAKPKAASQIGTPVRDGKFEFTVKSVKCGISTVGNEYLNTKAQGQFCAVQLHIENIGDEPQSMFADNQLAFDAKDRKFSADSTASIYDDSSQVLFEEINPGNSVKGKVYFDVPKGAKLTQLELHDSMFSDGVKVAL
ncbi:DUF4352 domain-containing protein [Terrabacter sp. Soil810]|uniref:DUF4352 domain-containing protein n=1 Tax=Terrabacter sp. Soil810 TaxID=1736418 RepID=UPI00070F2450|nr:DUF4352 domain-containing protein [Terrabacter sp. Soil810]KRF47037.1 hypothetical protein ASG96_03230 [Terrabacter sp. Soil810]